MTTASGAARAIGRTYTPPRPYEVSRAKIREFAAAIGDPTAACDQPEAAAKLGYPDLVAPPTFAFPIAGTALDLLLGDPDLGLALRRIIHGDQKFSYHRPITAGDILTATLTVDGVRNLRGADIITTSTVITDANGEPVCTASATLVHRAEATE